MSFKVRLLLFFACATLTHSAAFAYKPDPQSVRNLTGSTAPTIGTFRIYADTSDPSYSDLAQLLQNWIFDRTQLSLSIEDLADLGAYTQGPNEIILGDPALHPGLGDVVSSHNMSTLDLGEEGYLLHSQLAVDGSGVWRVIIIGNSLTGVQHGMSTFVEPLQSALSRPPYKIIRDYPDRPFRVYQYRLGKITGSDWLLEQEARIDSIAQLGVSGIQFPFHYAYDMEGSVAGRTQGQWLKDVFDYCRSLGIEPIPGFSPRVPGQCWDPIKTCYLPEERVQDPLWREGKFIKEEKWNVVADTLENDIGNFDNDYENISWTQGCADTTMLPNQWYNGPNSSWQYFGSCSGPGGSKMLKLYPTDADQSVWTKVTIRPGDYYVATLKFTKIEFSSGWPQLIVRNPERKFIPGGKTWFCWRALWPCVGSEEEPYVFELDFMVPPDSLTLGNDEVEIGIMTHGAHDCTIELVGISIDRRNAGFINLMVDDDLRFKVTSMDGSDEYVEWADYRRVLLPGSGDLHWEMHESNGPKYRVEWLSTPAPDSVLVSCTLGIPAPPYDPNANSVMVCFNNPDLRGLCLDALKSIFTNGLNPKYIHFYLDELRHMNTCGRCDSIGLDNAHYIVDFLNYLKAGLNSEGGAAAGVQFTALGDMFNPVGNGNPSYQHAGWLGQYGPTSGALGDLLGGIILYMWPRDQSEKVREVYQEAWPRSESEDASVVPSIGPPIPDFSGIGSEMNEWVTNPTWYEGDALGFFGYNWTLWAPAEDSSQEKLLKYAWKRYRNPDVTLQVFYPNGTYKTDDVFDHLVNVEKNKPLHFYPFGSPEPDCENDSLSSATLYWGNGSQTTVPLSTLNSGKIAKSFSQVGTYTVRLSITALGCDGQPSTREAAVRINVVPTCPREGCPDPTEESPSAGIEEPRTNGILLVAPNPFLHYATVHFSIQEPAVPEIRIYDVAGRLLRSEVLADRPAGDWQWTWDGKTDDGEEVRSGIYFIQMAAGQSRTIQRLVKLTP